MLNAPLMGGGAGVFTYEVTSNQTDFNLATALAAHPDWDGTAREITVTVVSGVEINATDTANAGFTTGSLPAG